MEPEDLCVSAVALVGIRIVFPEYDKHSSLFNLYYLTRSGTLQVEKWISSSKLLAFFGSSRDNLHPSLEIFNLVVQEFQRLKLATRFSY